MDTNIGDEVQTQVLDERKKEYGHFSVQFPIAQQLKDIMHRSPMWEKMDDVTKENLEMAATKLSRVLSGNPLHRDSYIDLIGYFTLQVEHIDMLVTDQDTFDRHG